jgi:hypothetical protein
MKDIEKELDRLVQQWASTQRSYLDGSKPCVGHHHIHRSCRLLRWDLHNIIPLTYTQHTLFHNGSLQYFIHNPFREEYLNLMKNKDLKDYLLENNLTEDEWLEKNLKNLKKYIDNTKNVCY